VIKVEMHFLPDVYVPCDVCHGKRYNRETLEVQYKGKNITEVLDMTVEDAHEFFKPVPVIARKLHTLLDVGLGYIKLGQSATTLSGGEAQRVKLSLELSKRDTGRTLYILDEPTTGLHFADIDLLLKVIHRLRDQGNTLVIIEHNLDVIKTADWIVDLGPEGGAGGGTIVAHRHAGGRGEEQGQRDRQVPVQGGDDDGTDAVSEAAAPATCAHLAPQRRHRRRYRRLQGRLRKPVPVQPRVPAPVRRAADAGCEKAAIGGGVAITARRCGSASTSPR
jgi:ATPase subunit of ABC transporter with duplicated ATPase domains